MTPTGLLGFTPFPSDARPCPGRASEHQAASVCADASTRCLATEEPACVAQPSPSNPSPEDASPEVCRARKTAQCCPPSSRRSRREQAQRARRIAEVEARRKAVAYAEQLAAQGISCPRAAAQLQIVPRTLRWWRQGQRKTAEVAACQNVATLRPGRLAPLFHFAYLGHPPVEVDVPTRNQIFGFLHHVTGPAIGLPALQALFRNVPRCILEDLLGRYRCVWRERYAKHGFELTWHYAGTVWAIDFTEPLQPIDGVFPYLLAIRDLASHCQLTWRPVRGETAEDVLPVLRKLFTEFGPPLVLKSDNGSAFIAAPLHDLLCGSLVAQLFSPVRRPQYNGALERNNGVLKVYTDQHAISAGHRFRWTAEDVDHAQSLANTISRPWGAGGPSPEQAWQARVPISFEERQTFLTAVDGHRQWAAGELALDLAADLSVADRARLDRLAISSTLQDLGYLTKQRIGHIERPKRLSRDALARRIAKFREQTPIADEPVTQAPTAEPPFTETPIMETPVVETPVAKASVIKPLVGQTPVREPQVAENPTPPRSPESVSAQIQDLVDGQLAELVSSDILLSIVHGGHRAAVTRASKPVCSRWADVYFVVEEVNCSTSFVLQNGRHSAVTTRWGGKTACRVCDPRDITKLVESSQCCDLAILGHRGTEINTGGNVSYCPCNNRKACRILPDPVFLEKELKRLFGDVNNCKPCRITLSACEFGRFAGPMIALAASTGCIVCGQRTGEGDETSVETNLGRCVDKEGNQVMHPNHQPFKQGELGNPTNLKRPPLCHVVHGLGLK